MTRRWTWMLAAMVMAHPTWAWAADAAAGVDASADLHHRTTPPPSVPTGSITRAQVRCELDAARQNGSLRSTQRRQASLYAVPPAPQCEALAGAAPNAGRAVTTRSP